MTDRPSVTATEPASAPMKHLTILECPVVYAAENDQALASKDMLPRFGVTAGLESQHMRVLDTRITSVCIWTDEASAKRYFGDDLDREGRGDLGRPVPDPVRVDRYRLRRLIRWRTRPASTPGIRPRLGPAAPRPRPRDVFRAENVETDFADCEELSDFCGLPASRLCLFRPERLVVHELLVRVMADLSIPLGSVYADLGVNFRRIVTTILREGIEAHGPAIRDELQAIRHEAEACSATRSRSCSMGRRRLSHPTGPAAVGSTV